MILFQNVFNTSGELHNMNYEPETKAHEHHMDHSSHSMSMSMTVSVEY